MTLCKLIARLEDLAFSMGANAEVVKVKIFEDTLLVEYGESVRVNMQEET